MSNDTLKKLKRWSTGWGKIFENHIPDKVPRVYQEFL